MSATQLERGLASGAPRAVALPGKAEGLAGRPKDIEVHLGREVMPSRRDIGVVSPHLLAVRLVQKVAHAWVLIAGKHVPMFHTQKLQSDAFKAQPCAIGADGDAIRILVGWLGQATN